MNNYEAIIGLEIHVQLKTRSKMFCASPNNPDETVPNTNICEVCTGQPGSLPVPNREAIKKALMVGLALNCEIPEYSKFDRKNYFYPDLPKGYQISQYDQPLCGRGEIEIPGRKIRITRAHLEEDAGKLIHEGHSSLVDLNRAGVPLLEIVTEPDFRSAAEAKLFLQSLRNIVRYLGVSDADMEKGHLRCDANVSIRSKGQTELPDYKVEIKNMNSFKAIEAGLNHEIQRQAEAYAAGEKLHHETRGWDERQGVTVKQRLKEEAQDYRYFPEPDLPVMHFTKEFVAELRDSLPELPAAKRARFISQFGLPERDADVLIADRNLAGYFEEVVSELMAWVSSSPSSPLAGEDARRAGEGRIHRFAKTASNWIAGDFQALLKAANLDPQDSKITAENFAELIKMVDKGEVSGHAAKKILAIMFKKGGDPSNIAQDEGLGQVSDEAAITEAVDKVVAANPKVLADYRAGKKQALGFLVGKVMAVMKGKANPSIVNKLLIERL